MLQNGMNRTTLLRTNFSNWRRAIVPVALLLFVSNAFAADIGCGWDTDKNGTVDSYCPGLDPDYDGYTVAEGDCDNYSFGIRPGRPDILGCPAGEYRVCKADGTGWTDCVASASDPYCPDNDDHAMVDYTDGSIIKATTCYYISKSSGNDSTGDGSYATPWENPSMAGYYSSGAPSGHHSPTAGDAFIILGGTYDYYTSNYNGRTSVFMARGYSANATNRFFLLNYPGQTPKFSNTTNSTNLYLENSDYWVISGIEIGDALGSGLIAAESDNIKVFDSHIHDTDGVENDNATGLSFSTVNDGTLMYSFVHDNFDRDDLVGQNNYNVFSFRGTNTILKRNAIFNTGGNSSGGYKQKHANPSSSALVEHNVFQNTNENASRAVQLAGQNTTLRCNRFKDIDSEAISYVDPGGCSYFGGSLVEHNTFEDVKHAIGGTPHKRYNESEDPCSTYLATDCSGDGDFDPIIFRWNLVDNADVGDTGVAQFGQYSSDVMYDAFIGAGKLQTNDNLLYNSAATIQYGLFQAANADETCSGRGVDGAVYTGLAAIQAAGFETSSIVANPSLSSVAIPSDDYLDYGWTACLEFANTPTVFKSANKRSIRRRLFLKD